jgi:ABC-type multidrug transport system ATPase subunit
MDRKESLAVHISIPSLVCKSSSINGQRDDESSSVMTSAALSTIFGKCCLNSGQSKQINNNNNNGNHKTILSNIEFDIKQNSNLAILGTSGCGKSTLIKFLCQRLPSKYYQAQNASIANVQQYKIAYVPQDLMFCEQLTVYETLEFYYCQNLCNQFGNWRNNLSKTSIIQQAIHDMELVKQSSTFVSRLSGGERKRLAIACQLLQCMPDTSVVCTKATVSSSSSEQKMTNSKTNQILLLLDEPTSGLSSGEALHLVKTVLTGKLAQNMTTVMTLHQPRPEILQLFSDVLVLNPFGQIHSFGSRQALLEKVMTKVQSLHEMKLNHHNLLNLADYLMDELAGMKSSSSCTVPDTTCNSDNKDEMSATHTITVTSTSFPAVTPLASPSSNEMVALKIHQPFPLNDIKSIF